MVKACKICKQPFIKSSILSFHSIPKIPDLRKRWLLALNLDESAIVPSAMICSKHFSKEDFIIPSRNNSKRLLKKGAIPSLLMLSDNSVDSSENNNTVYCYPLLEHSYVKLWSNQPNYNAMSKGSRSLILKKRGAKSTFKIFNSYVALREKYLKSRILVKYLKRKNSTLERQVIMLKKVVQNSRKKSHV